MLYYLIRRMLRFLLSARTISLAACFSVRSHCHFGRRCVCCCRCHPVANTCSHSLYHSRWPRDGKPPRCHRAPNNCAPRQTRKFSNDKCTVVFDIVWKETTTQKTNKWWRKKTKFDGRHLPMCLCGFQCPYAHFLFTQQIIFFYANEKNTTHTHSSYIN